MDGDEWKTAAVGPMKRRLSASLSSVCTKNLLLAAPSLRRENGIRASRCRVGRSAVTGEKTVSRFGKTKPLCQRIANYGSTEADARRFALTLAAAVGVDPRQLLAAYEDVFYYMWKERRLPGNVDPYDSKLEKKEERDRLACIFQQGLMPSSLRASAQARLVDGELKWQTSSWFMRDERLYLTPVIRRWACGFRSIRCRG